MIGFTESHVEEAALEWLGGLGYAVRLGPDISPLKAVVMNKRPPAPISAITSRTAAVTAKWGEALDRGVTDVDGRFDPIL